MGEYARRKSDNVEIKVGTCEDMYYLRYEDRHKVILDDGSSFGNRWRLPIPEEDHIKPGDYDAPYFRGGFVPLLPTTVCGDDGEDELISFTPNPEVADHPGTLQIHHDSGLLLNIKCHHGIRLPEAGGGLKSAFWSGKANHQWNLVCLKDTAQGMLPVVACATCGHMYRESSWAAVIDFITDPILRERLIMRYP